MPDRTYRVVLWSLALLGLMADQASKYGVFAWLRGVETHRHALFQTEPQRGFFLEVSFDPETGGPHVNHGALFGLFRDHKTFANLGFALISLLAAAGIIVWSRHTATARDRWLCASLGLILAGTLGNLYDRLLFNGVRDFLHWNYLFDWPVFNIADVCLVCGAGMLMIQAFLVPHGDPTNDKGPAHKALAGVAAGAGVAGGTPVG
jgi:lipoprotein signal peptidase